MGYELLLVKGVDNNPGYDQVINGANVEDDLKGGNARSGRACNQ